MRITHEADYAIRVTYILATEKSKLSAKQISEQSGVSLRFALKILRKLIGYNIVKSYKGVHGGYEFAKHPQEVSIGEIIEIIDGPIVLNHCLSNEFDCSFVEKKYMCDFHRVFATLNTKLRDDLYDLKISQFIQQ